MLMSDLTKEHKPVDLPTSMKACLIAKWPVKLIQPIPNSTDKRVRKMEINRYAGLDNPVIIPLSDERTSDENEKGEGDT